MAQHSESQMYRNPKTGMIESWVPKESKYVCKCSGCIAPNGMCPYIKVSSKLCGAEDEYECTHKELRVEGVNDQGE